MNTAFLKDALREIKRTPERFLSVLLIVALGCGFFSGIKSTKPAMVDTAADYFKEYRLMDLKLTSTIGVRSPDVEAVKKADHVRGAHAAYSKEVFYTHKNQNLVLKCISFNSSLDDSSPNLMNKLNVIEGRLPENSGECAVEIKLSSPDTFRLGNVLEFTDPDDTKELTETLENSSYKIVGIVTSPLYIGYERDATTEGNGTIASNVFLREEEFITPYYTEMFVDLEGLDEEDPFSQEYRDSVKEMGAAAEEAFTESVKARFEKLHSQAQDRITAAQNTADLLNEYVNMDYTSLRNSYPRLVQAVKKAKEAYEAQLEKGKRGLLEKSAMLKAEKAVSVVEELLSDGNDPAGEAHLKYVGELDQAYRDIDEAAKQLRETADPAIYCFDRFEASSDYSSFDGDSRKVDRISRVFPVFFLLVAGLVCLTTMSRLIEEQRSTIGIYKALGYSQGAILGRYLAYSGTAAVVGGAVGAAAGMVIFPRVIYQGYKLLYNIPRLETPLRIGYAAGCMLAALCCIGGVTAFTCLRELKDIPATLMRPRPPRAGRRVLLENFPKLWGKLSFMGKVTTRNMLRYKRRFFMSLAGVAGCTALIITGFGLKHSISSVVDKQFGEVFVYDGIAVLNGRFTYDELDRKLDSIDEIGVYMQSMLTEYDISAEGGSTKASVCVPDQPARLEHFVQLRDTDDHTKLSPERGTVIITEKLAKILDIEAGDTITLTSPDEESTQVTVGGISVNYAFHYIFMTPETYTDCFGKDPAYNIAFVNLLENTDFQQFRYTLMDSECFYGLTYKDDQCEGYLNSTDSMNTVVAVLIISAGLLAAVVLYDLASINITERTREIATIKVLGFFDSETDDYILRENLISSLLGIIVGLPVGRLLHYFVTVTAEVDILMFNHDLSPAALLYGALLTALFSLAVNVVLHFVLTKVDMIGSLKSVE